MPQSSQTQGAVLVLGMHRSGTSALTRGLEVLGIDLGRNLKPPVEGDNDKGFFEDFALSQINDELLGLIDGHWAGLLARDASDAEQNAVNALKLRAMNSIEERFGDARYFGFKDPRSCRAMPFWKDVLSRLALKPVYVIAFRNPMDVARSLERRDGFPRSRSYYLWLLHTLAAVRHTMGERRVFVDYETLLADPETVLTRIADAIDDPSMTIEREALHAYCSNFLDLQLHHNKGPATRLDLDAQCPPDVRAVYALLQNAARSGDALSEADEEAWRAQFDAFDRIAPYTALLAELDRRTHVLYHERETLAAEVVAAGVRLTALEASLASQANASDRLRDELDARETAADALKTESAKREAQALEREAEAAASAVASDRAHSLARTQIVELEARLQRQLELSESNAALRAEYECEKIALQARLAEADLSLSFEAQRLEAAKHKYEGEIAALSAAHAHEHASLRAHIEQASALLERERQSFHDQLTASRDRAGIQDERIRDLLGQLAAHREQARERESQATTRDSEAQARLEQVALAYAESSARAAGLAAAYDKLAERLRSVYASSSWRLTGPMRSLKASLAGGHINEAVPSASDIAGGAPEPIAPVPYRPIATAPALSDAPRPSIAFFTICSRNFLAFAKTLYQTLKEHHPEAQFYVALCDAPDAAAPFDPAQEPFPFIYLDDIDLPQWREMSQRYNITEFNTAIKPFVIRHMMQRGLADCIAYVDPDIIVKSRMVEVEDAFANGALGVLTPHITGPAENTEVSDVKMLQYGVYNLGFAAFRTCPEAMHAMEWWGRRLINDCVIKLEEGLFVDQKWADLLPAFLPNLHILRHPGYNVAYWNVSQRSVVLSNGAYTVNGQPLRFAHFSGSKLEDPSVFSRHTGQFKPTNIGDLVHLLGEYRDRVFGNNHAQYQRIPYAFSWNGHAGVNLHTPEPEHQKRGNGGAEPPAPAGSAGKPATPVSGVARAFRMVRTASNLTGGLPQLAVKATQILATGGIGAVKQRMRLVETVAAEQQLRADIVAETPPQPAMEADESDEVIGLGWRRKLLYVDWSTPRPDRDAGSLTAFHLLESFVHLGFDVTFVPSDLEYLGAYTEALRAMGIRCLHREDIGSMKAHLEDEGEAYDIAFLCRAPIAGLYIADIRAHAPNAKIVLNTSDLHYLRETREAELSGERGRIEAAQKAKDWELGIIGSCDVTIVLSEVERELLANELPGSDVRCLPLIIADVDPERPAFAERKDMVFIGSYPHLPNVDAVLYFAREIFPLVRAKLPDVVWHVVGNAPPPEVLALGDQPGIQVHGYVKDIAPLFRSTRLSVAPLRYGAGIKGKLGTSMSYGAPAVATSIAVEGMGLVDGEQVLVADDPQAFADRVVELYQNEALWTRLSEAGCEEMLHAHSSAAVHGRIASLLQDVAPDNPQLSMYAVRSHGEYELLNRFLRDELTERRELELSHVRWDEPSFRVPGFCAVCGEPSEFTASLMYASGFTDDGREIPNWREHLDCARCGLQNRLRASLHMFYAHLRPRERSKIYLTEQSTPLFSALKARHPELIGSEYLGDRCALGTEWEGLRNEDLTRLTFADNSFDYALSFDVMEHVSDDLAAMREVFRCLKPGGRFLFTAPFSIDHKTKVVRARMHDDGAIEHILEPEYHGNPVDPEKGALCFRYFAWDMMDDLRRAGFENCRALNYWSYDLAYFGPNQFVFVADKPRKLRTH